MNRREKSPAGEMSHPVERTIAERATTLVARGLADLQLNIPRAETEALIAEGNIFTAIAREDIDAVRQILKSDPTKANVQLGQKAANEFNDLHSLPYPFRFAAEDTPIHLAAVFGHERTANLIIAAGGDVNAKPDDGVTPIHKALCNPGASLSKVVSILLAAGADVNILGCHSFFKDQRAPLHDCRDVEIARMLVNHGARIDVRGGSGETPLRIGCENGEFELVEFLIEAGSNPHQRSSRGENLLHCCASKEVAQLLVGLGVSPLTTNPYGATPLHAAAWKGNVAMAEYLLSIGADPNAKDILGKTPLHDAVSGGWILQYMRFAIAKRKSPFDFSGHVKTTRILLTHGADPNLRMSATFKVLDGIEESVYGFVPSLQLTRAAIHHKASTFSDCVAFMFDEIGELNVRKIYGRYFYEAWRMLNPKERSCSQKWEYIPNDWEYILEQRDRHGKPARRTRVIKGPEHRLGDTPLHLAVVSGDSVLVRVLLDEGVDPNPLNDLGMTPLQIAATEGHNNIVEQLLASGAYSDGLGAESCD